MTHEQLVHELLRDISKAYFRYISKCNHYKFNRISVDVEAIDEHFAWVSAIQKYDKYILEVHRDNLAMDSIADERYIANYTNPLND
jgi:hypothetical protein